MLAVCIYPTEKIKKEIANCLGFMSVRSTSSLTAGNENFFDVDIGALSSRIGGEKMTGLETPSKLRARNP